MRRRKLVTRKYILHRNIYKTYVKVCIRVQPLRPYSWHLIISECYINRNIMKWRSPGDWERLGKRTATFVRVLHQCRQNHKNYILPMYNIWISWLFLCSRPWIVKRALHQQNLVWILAFVRESYNVNGRINFLI